MPLVLRHELDARAGATCELASLARLQLDVVDERARRDVRERQCVPRLDVGLRARLYGGADAQPRRREDVRLRPVGVVQERDPRRPVRVVLDRGDLRRHAVLETLEVDHAVAALVAAALVAPSDAAVLVAPARALQRLDQALLRLALRHVVEGGDRHEPPAWAGGLVLPERHYAWAPSKISIDSPGRSWTIAFFQPGFLPRTSPRRFGFARIWTMFTPWTWTPNNSSTACRTCVLCGWGPSTSPPLDVLERRLADQERPRANEVLYLELPGNRDENAVEVPERLDQVLVLRVGDDEERELLRPGLDQLGRGLRRGFAERARPDHPKGTALCVRRQGTAQGGTPGLPVHLPAEAPRPGRKGHPAARPLRGADRTGAGAPGALLAPGLRAPARDERAILSAPRPGPRRVQLGPHGLVDEVRLHVGPEYCGLERQALRLLAFPIQHGRPKSRHGCGPPSPRRSRSWARERRPSRAAGSDRGRPRAPSGRPGWHAYRPSGRPFARP